ncbi:MAG TPA: serine/threonine-protein kinase, partial [Burkholderiaceae bacterium]|nr:serine/threonine-protein kinase [Burkholderiaceae bacterium]
HRDIKPANMILLADGSVKLADFGVARIDRSELTQTGMVLGTPMYMAPEQMLGLEVDYRADLFACGVVLYQFLTGERPFTGSVTAVMQKVLNEPVDPPSHRNSALVPAWDAVLNMALAKKPEQRFATAQAFATAIQRATLLQQGADSKVSRPSDGTTIAWPVATDAPSPAPPSRPAPVAALLALAGVAVGGYWWSQSGTRVPEGPGPTPPASAVAGLAPYAASATSVTTAASTRTGTVEESASSAAASVVAKSGNGNQGSIGSARPEAARTQPRAGDASRATAEPAAAPPRPRASTPVALQVKTPAPAAVALPAPPPPTTTALEWQAARSRLAEANVLRSLGEALVRLLDLRSADERQLVIGLEQWLQRRPASALVLGAGDGWLQFSWRSAMPTVGEARALAMQRCREFGSAPPAQACRVVWSDGQLDRAAFDEVASGLGERSLGSVRSGFLTNLGKALSQVMAQAQASAQVPVSAPPRPPPPAGTAADSTTSALPHSAWLETRHSLQQGRGRQSLAQSLGKLLQVESADDQQLLKRFEQKMQRLPWKSALAMGEGNGLLGYGFTWNESRGDHAAERALGICNRVSTQPCVIVMTNGRLLDEGLWSVAMRLGARPPSAVREALLPYLRRDSNRD